MDNIKCPNCGYENKNSNIRCEVCNNELNHIEKNNNFLNRDYSQENVKIINYGGKKTKVITNAILIFMLAPGFITGLIFVCVSSYANITNNKSKNYLETEGKLVGFENCQYDNNENEVCNGVYEYTINGISYEGSPNILSSRSSFKQTAIIKYNPNNPNEYVMNSGWNWILIIGIIIVTIDVIIFISVKTCIKKLSKKANDIEKDNSMD